VDADARRRDEGGQDVPGAAAAVLELRRRGHDAFPLLEGHEKLVLRHVTRDREETSLRLPVSKPKLRAGFDDLPLQDVRLSLATVSIAVERREVTLARGAAPCRRPPVSRWTNSSACRWRWTASSCCRRRWWAPAFPSIS
jgi:hypothetical protein